MLCIYLKGGISLEFVGELVEHKAFGSGKIIEFKDTYIVVKFESGSQKDFVFPDVFDSYLLLNNKKLSKQVEEKLIVYREKEAARKLAEEERRREKFRIDMMRAEMEKSKNTVSKKVDSNIAFKCSYCNGGSTDNIMGYRAVCSDENINYNINIAKNKVCSAPECNCYQYLNGNISRAELDSRNDENNNSCYESQLLNQWRSYPDISFKENSGAKVKNLKNVNRGSLVLLTTIMPNEKEKDRIIFGVYFLQEDYDMDYQTKGYLGADEKFKVELTPGESKKLKFWDFYYNPKNPEKISNTSILYRYFDDVQSAQVLKSICEIKKGTEDEAISKDVFDRYCNIKNIDNSAIPELKGALQVQKVTNA